MRSLAGSTSQVVETSWSTVVVGNTSGPTMRRMAAFRPDGRMGRSRPPGRPGDPTAEDIAWDQSAGSETAQNIRRPAAEHGRDLDASADRDVGTQAPAIDSDRHRLSRADGHDGVVRDGPAVDAHLRRAHDGHVGRRGEPQGRPTSRGFDGGGVFVVAHEPVGDAQCVRVGRPCPRHPETGDTHTATVLRRRTTRLRPRPERCGRNATVGRDARRWWKC